MDIRQLKATPKDIKLWKDLRLQALKEYPIAFNSSYEEESSWGDKIFKRLLENNTMFGGFHKNELVATCCFHQHTSLHKQHRGFLWGMYTAEPHRQKGFATQLLEHTIDHARQHVIQLHLTCVTLYEDIAKFYEKAGFDVYGTEPRSILIDGDYFDVYLMVMDLTDYTAHDTTFH